MTGTPLKIVSVNEDWTDCSQCVNYFKSTNVIFQNDISLESII